MCRDYLHFLIYIVNNFLKVGIIYFVLYVNVYFSRLLFIIDSSKYLVYLSVCIYFCISSHLEAPQKRLHLTPTFSKRALLVTTIIIVY